MVVCLSPQRPGVDHGPLYVGSVVDQARLGEVFLRVFQFSTDVIPPMLPTHILFVCHRRYKIKAVNIVVEPNTSVSLV